MRPIRERDIVVVRAEALPRYPLIGAYELFGVDELKDDVARCVRLAAPECAGPSFPVADLERFVVPRDGST